MGTPLNNNNLIQRSLTYNPKPATSTATTGIDPNIQIRYLPTNSGYPKIPYRYPANEIPSYTNPSLPAYTPPITTNYPNTSTSSDVNSLKKDYRTLNRQERQQVSNMSDRNLAIEHLWGRVMSYDNQNDPTFDSLYDTVLAFEKNGIGPNGEKFTSAEVALVKELIAYEMKTYGRINQAGIHVFFLKHLAEKTGQDVSEYLQNVRTDRTSSGKMMDFGGFKIGTDFGKEGFERFLEKKSGQSKEFLQTIRMWSHDGVTNGKHDGSIMLETLGLPYALDQSQSSKEFAQQLLEIDLIDGQNQGSAINNAFSQALGSAYLKKGPVSLESIKTAEVQSAVRAGLSLKQIGLNVQNAKVGAQRAVELFKQTVANNPVKVAAYASSLAALGAVCPYVACLGAVAPIANGLYNGLYNKGN